MLTFSLLLLGALYLGYLLNLLDGPIFFSGDGGVKYLMAKQFVRGDVSPTLVLPADAETGELWRKGLYPLDAPFVYDIDGRKIVCFPLYFPLVSAPFLAAMGWRGLYVLTAAGVLLLWIWIFLRSRAAQLCTTAVCAVLLSVIFAGPLTLYGVMYWEHAPAVLLAAIPLIIVLRKRGARPSAAGLSALGVLSGTSAFLRWEAMVCILCAIGVSLLCFGRERIRDTLFFSLGFVISVSAFLAANRLIYGNIIGLHSSLVLGGKVLPPWLARGALNRIAYLVTQLFRYWPSCAFAALCLPFALFGSYSRKREMLACFLVLAISIPLIALIVPTIGGKQWGPRYLLVLIPWGAVAAGFVVEAVVQHRTLLVKASASLILVLCLAQGARVNTYHGTRFLAADYRFRILPALRLIEKQPQQFVMVTHQFIAQELAALVDKKSILLVDSEEEILQTKADLFQRGVHSIPFVTYKWMDDPEGFDSYGEMEQSSSLRIRILKRGE